MVKVQGLPIKKKEQIVYLLQGKKNGIRRKQRKKILTSRKKGQKGKKIGNNIKQARRWWNSITIYINRLNSTIERQKLSDKIKCKFLSYDIIKQHT